MRKLILQMQTSVDGFVSSADSGLGWLLWDWSDKWTWDAALKRDFNAIIAAASCILLSRKMAEEGYIGHWGRIARKHAGERDFAFAERIGALEKAVVSRKLRSSAWERTILLRGGLDETVAELKAGKWGDILVFGGTGFASALVAAGLVDEYQFFVNPVALGTGRSVFAKARAARGLRLLRSDAYPCGIVVNRYGR